MPGLKDRDDGPEKLLLARLCDPGVTPVLVLEPRDMEQRHAVYDLLEQAHPPRKRDAIIALQNKCDQLVSSNWQNLETWKGHCEGTQKRGFKTVFFTGMPTPPRSGSEEEHLQRCWVREATMFSEWGARVGHTPEHEKKMGIKAFAKCIAEDQMARAEQFAIQLGPDVQRLLDEVSLQRIRAMSDQNNCIDNLMRLLCEMCGWVKEALRGEVDSHTIPEELIKDVHGDLDWLLQNFKGSTPVDKTYESRAKEHVDGLRDGSPNKVLPLNVLPLCSLCGVAHMHGLT
mmetsp:Transcript_127216/g.406796  ORF Transcript_127216/g.406796 Transcript_127216/m.406796 type:complete len:286 (-) Transcript_127216:1089-1946(-)